MSSTNSVSKGVFAFKRSKGKKYDARTVDYWPAENEEERETTFNNYIKCMKIVTDITENLQRRTHAKVFRDLVQFIKTAHQRNTKDTRQYEDIPTACLLTGVNMPDHNDIFGSIGEMVTDEVTQHVARLQSQECSTVRGAVFKMVSQLMKKSVSLEEFEEETGPSVKRAQCTMPVLTSWYQDQINQEGNLTPTKTGSSPCKGKKRKSVNSPPKDAVSPRKKAKLTSEKDHLRPVVVIFEDVESFPSNVLQDLILICREHIQNIPFVFIFGVATTSSAVHGSLSQDTSSCLAMETFQAQPSTHYLNEVIDEVLMSPKVPFHVGGRTFKLLLDIFLYHDLSVKNFCRALQVCMIEHFSHTNGASYLCCTSTARRQLINTMQPAQLDTIRKLPSFRTYVESCQPKEQAALLINEQETKEKIVQFLEEIESYYARFCCLVKIVNVMTCTLPRSPLGRQVREVMATCLSRPLVETEEYEEVQRMFKQLSREEILPILNNSLKMFEEKSEEDEILGEFYAALTLIVGQLNNLDQVCQEEDPKEEKLVAIQAKDRFQLKEKLEELAKMKKKTNPYEEVRSELMKLLENTFREHMIPPTKKPLHEVLFFDSSTVIKRHLVGNTRAALTTALANPHHYLQCQCCTLDEPTNIVTSLPDISVAYKLHLECGRLINLYDWLQAFVSVINPDIETSVRKVNKTYQARFVQALLELQFLGFVKQTRRKTDHVARLTWGGC